MIALHMSKRSWTPELQQNVYDMFRAYPGNTYQRLPSASKYVDKVVKWGPVHPTLISFIDLSFTVEGLHRAGQDDWDSHARRFQNRIVRSSTRLASFTGEEKSDYYKDKIITTDEILSARDISVPDRIMKGGHIYIRCVNGYVREDLAGDQDVLRGLYMLSIPSNFIFRCNLREFAHIYKERNSQGTANPEVKELAEKCASLLEEFDSRFNRELLMKIRD